MPMPTLMPMLPGPPMILKTIAAQLLPSRAAGGEARATSQLRPPDHFGTPLLGCLGVFSSLLVFFALAFGVSPGWISLLGLSLGLPIGSLGLVGFFGGPCSSCWSSSSFSSAPSSYSRASGPGGAEASAVLSLSHSSADSFSCAVSCCCA